jgi:hypothetical protein
MLSTKADEGHDGPGVQLRDLLDRHCSRACVWFEVADRTRHEIKGNMLVNLYMHAECRAPTIETKNKTIKKNRAEKDTSDRGISLRLAATWPSCDIERHVIVFSTPRLLLDLDSTTPTRRMPSIKKFKQRQRPSLSEDVDSVVTMSSMDPE